MKACSGQAADKALPGRVCNFHLPVAISAWLKAGFAKFAWLIFLESFPLLTLPGLLFLAGICLACFCLAGKALPNRTRRCLALHDMFSLGQFRLCQPD